MSNAKRRHRRRWRLNRNHPQCPVCLLRDWHKLQCSYGRALIPRLTLRQERRSS